MFRRWAFLFYTIHPILNATHLSYKFVYFLLNAVNFSQNFQKYVPLFFSLQDIYRIACNRICSYLGVGNKRSVPFANYFVIIIIIMNSEALDVVSVP